MTRLPVCSGAEAIKTDSPLVLTVPLHDELGPGLLWALIRKAGLSVDELAELLT